jgi:hypothetical protein
LPSSGPDSNLPPKPVIFLLSPAWCGGKRAQLLLNERATFPLAERLSQQGRADIAEVFSFVSGLYFRGKVAYAREFARPMPDHPASLVITPSRGLVPMETPVSREDLMEFAMIDIATDDERFRTPFVRDAAILASRYDGDIVLLGSVATGKYVDALVELLGKRLLFPIDFVGRGDMSRGGLMLQRVRDGRELDYVPVEGAIRHGQRPPRLSRQS